MDPQSLRCKAVIQQDWIFLPLHLLIVLSCNNTLLQPGLKTWDRETADWRQREREEEGQNRWVWIKSNEIRKWVFLMGHWPTLPDQKLIPPPVHSSIHLTVMTSESARRTTNRGHHRKTRKHKERERSQNLLYSDPVWMKCSEMDMNSTPLRLRNCSGSIINHKTCLLN